MCCPWAGRPPATLPRLGCKVMAFCGCWASVHYPKACGKTRPAGDFCPKGVPSKNDVFLCHGWLEVLGPHLVVFLARGTKFSLSEVGARRGWVMDLLKNTSHASIFEPLGGLVEGSQIPRLGLVERKTESAPKCVFGFPRRTSPFVWGEATAWRIPDPFFVANVR